MGKIRDIPYVKPLVGILGPDPEALDAVRAWAVSFWGPLADATEPEVFLHTEYYTREMGAGLWRQFLVFGSLRDAAELPDWKLATNGFEQQFGLNAHGGRRVNLDPGYLAPGKLVLASTKDHEQRIYLRAGIFAEVTLHVRQGRFCTWEWTYPDYAQSSAFFDRMYQNYLQEIKSGPASR